MIIFNIPSPSAIPVALSIIFIVYYVLRWLRYHSISHLPGPKPGPWHVGNMQELFRSEPTNAVVSQWTEKYGGAIRIKGPFGADLLLLSDPKALQYILNTSGYNVVQPQQVRVLTRLISGEGLPFHEGVEHARQRRIITPSFQFGTLRNFIPIFRTIARRTIARWCQIIANAGGPTVIEVTDWLSRTSLDTIGEVGFGYKFGAIDDDNSELSRVYRNLIPDAFYKRSDSLVMFQALCGYIPFPVVKFLLSVLPTKQLKRFRSFMRVAGSVAQKVIDTQTQAYIQRKEGGKDIMSILVRANISESPRTKLSEKDLKAQLTTFMFAGHETTSSIMSWALYELAIHPEHQARLREEISMTWEETADRGDSELTVPDLDSMPFLTAVIKETLRFHPPGPMILRDATCDMVIPLSKPIKSKTGNQITAIPVSKGQAFFLSIPMYNRLKFVWGEDANEWRPERFLEDNPAKLKTGFGVISNLGTFGSGLHSCLGWQFAMIEIKTILIEFVQHFEFSPTPATKDVISGAIGTIAPMLKSKHGKAQLPLLVTPVQNNEDT